MIAKLEYRGISSSLKARARAKVRMTPTQVVVLSGKWEIEQLQPGGMITGGREMRFRQSDFRPIPWYPNSSGWRLIRLIEGTAP